MEGWRRTIRGRNTPLAALLLVGVGIPCVILAAVCYVLFLPDIMRRHLALRQRNKQQRKAEAYFRARGWEW